MDHWSRHARQWALVGPPLRPAPDDVAIARAALVPGRVLVLGVTPELAAMARGAGAPVVAIDRSREMIEAIYPHPGTAVRGDWLALPFADRSIDVVLGDGALTNLRFPDEYVALAGELRRVLAPGGRAVLRVFAPPAPPADGFHALKWALAMAIAPRDRNVAVAAIRDAFDARFPDRDALAARTGWPRAVIDTIDAYRGSALRYSFPTLDEIAGVLGPFEVRAGPVYPTLVWVPR